MSSGTEGNTEGKQGGTDVEDDSSDIYVCVAPGWLGIWSSCFSFLNIGVTNAFNHTHTEDLLFLFLYNYLREVTQE